MLKIWGRVNSVNVKKALWAAEELGLKYERVDAGMQLGVNKTPEYMKMNPTRWCRRSTTTASCSGSRTPSCAISPRSTAPASCGRPICQGARRRRALDGLGVHSFQREFQRAVFWGADPHAAREARHEGDRGGA